MNIVWVRTCQECGHKQTTKPPTEYKGDSWKDLKCRRCHSEALDYGSDGYTLVGGKITRIEEDD